MDANLGARASDKTVSQVSQKGYKVEGALTEAQQETLNHLVKAGLMQTCKKVFGRSFVISAGKLEDGTLRLRFEEHDSGNDYMTVHDMACLLQTDEASVRRMTGARAQRQSRLPVPFFKLQGKMLRFDRKKIQEWLQQMSDMTASFKPETKRGRPRGRPRKQR
jgi:hypothetical protein